MSEKKQRHFIVVWSDSWQCGSHTVSIPRWRPIITYLTVKEIVKEHEDQFGPACIYDVIDVTDPNNIRSVFDENT